MILNVVYLLLGLALILFGANALTDGSSAIAKRFNISDLVIGLTIVAFGTSAPELVISVMASMRGSADISLGNIVGSNIFNLSMIVGFTAILVPLKIGTGMLSREIALSILASVVLFVCANDILFDSTAANIVSRGDGLLLLCFFIIFMRYTFAIAHKASNDHEVVQQVKALSFTKASIYIVAGLCALIFGGNIFVDGASGVALGLGVEESVIGLTLVAGGTSLPELATSIVAAYKHNAGMAIGNAIGSCLFNVFFVLGISATINPINILNISNVDLSALIGASLMVWFFGLFFKYRLITRAEGIILVSFYVLYTIYLIHIA